MRPTSLLWAVLGASLLAVTPSAEVNAQQYPRRYNSIKYQGNGYQYRYYMYHSPRTGRYHYHVMEYHPARPRYVYYRNSRGTYWGRYDLRTGLYSTLAEQDRSNDLDAIPEARFPVGGPMPPPEPGLDGMLPPPEAGTGVQAMPPPPVQLSGNGAGCHKH